MAKFFNFNNGTRVCVDDMQVRYIIPVTDIDGSCRSMYSKEELADITEKKPAGIRRSIVSRGGDRVYDEHAIIAYEVTVIFHGTIENKIYLRVDEYSRFLETLGVEDSEDTDETRESLGPLPQSIFNSSPEWSKYAAMDEDGSIYFYDEEPKLCEDYDVWESVQGTRTTRYLPYVSWKESLTRRAK